MRVRGNRLRFPAFLCSLALWATLAGQDTPVDSDQLCENLKGFMPIDFYCYGHNITQRKVISENAEVVILNAGGDPNLYGLFVADRRTGTHRLTVDVLSPGSELRFIDADESEIRCEFGDFDRTGVDGKLKYFIDLAKETASPRIEYRDQPIEQIAACDDRVLFVGRRMWVLVAPVVVGQVFLDIDREDSERPPIELDKGCTVGAFEDLQEGLLPEQGWGQWRLINPTAETSFRVEDTSGVSQIEVVRYPRSEDSTGGFQIGDIFYPVPKPSPETFRKFRPETAEMMRRGRVIPAFHICIGPRALVGHQIIFGIDFYDGEGESGVGGYGVFDIETRQSEMHYLKEAADWSCSAVLVDGDEIWLGLRDRPEGPDFSGGLLRYDRVTGKSTHYEIPEIIFAIARREDRIYIATANGVGVIREGKLSRSTFDVNRQGEYYLRLEK